MSHPMAGGGMGGWSMLRSLRNRDEVSAHELKRGTARRIVAFARPYRRDIVVFLITVIVAAVIGVATPLLAGDVIDAIAGGGPDARTTVVRLALIIAALAVADALLLPGPAVVFGPHRRGHHPRPAHPGLRPRPADAAAVLHPHADRRAGQPAQQRRARRAAGVHLDAVRRGQQRHPARAHRRRDARAVLADHRAGAGPAADLHPPGPPGRAGGWPRSPASRTTSTPR